MKQLSIEQLKTDLEILEKGLTHLQGQRTQLANELGQIDASIYGQQGAIMYARQKLEMLEQSTNGVEPVAAEARG